MPVVSSDSARDKRTHLPTAKLQGKGPQRKWSEISMTYSRDPAGDGWIPVSPANSPSSVLFDRHSLCAKDSPGTTRDVPGPKFCIPPLNNTSFLFVIKETSTVKWSNLRTKGKNQLLGCTRRKGEKMPRQSSAPPADLSLLLRLTICCPLNSLLQKGLPESWLFCSQKAQSPSPAHTHTSAQSFQAVSEQFSHLKTSWNVVFRKHRCDRPLACALKTAEGLCGFLMWVPRMVGLSSFRFSGMACGVQVETDFWFFKTHALTKKRGWRPLIW